MVSEQQKREMVANLGYILKEMLTANNIKEISVRTGIPRSTIKGI